MTDWDRRTLCTRAVRKLGGAFHTPGLRHANRAPITGVKCPTVPTENSIGTIADTQRKTGSSFSNASSTRSTSKQLGTGCTASNNSRPFQFSTLFFNYGVNLDLINWAMNAPANHLSATPAQ